MQMPRQPVVLALAALCALLACGCGVAMVRAVGEAADNCVAETPVITSFTVSDSIDFGDSLGPVPRLLEVTITARSEASNVFVRFTADRGVYVLDVTDWRREKVGSTVYFVLNKWMTPMDPQFTYKIELMRFTDLAGGVTELTDFSQFGGRQNFDTFEIRNSKPAVAPQLPVLTINPPPSAGLLVQTQDSAAYEFKFRAVFGPGALFGKLTFSYACNSDATVPTLTFTTTNATCTYPSATQTRCDGTVPLVVAKGTAACNYQLNSVVVSDSSLQSMRYPTPLDPAFGGYSPQVLVVRNLYRDDVAPQLLGDVRFTVTNSTYAPGVANTTFGARQVLMWFQAIDTALPPATVSGLKSITFSGQFSTGLQLSGVVTAEHLVNASAGLYVYPIRLPHGFPPATWSFTSAITLTDRAQNVFSKSSDATFSVACGNPITVVEDDRMKGDPALNGIVALMFILLALALLLCFFLLRRQRQKYEFDHNVDIPAVPGTQLPEGDGAADDSNARDVSQSRGSRVVAPAASPNEQFDRSARDAVAEMAAARAEMEAQRQRDEAAHAAERERAAREAAATAASTTAAAAAEPAAAAADAGASVVVDVAAPAVAAAGPGASPAKPQTADALHAVGEQHDMAIQLGAPASPNTAAAAQAANAAQPDLL